MSVEIKQVQIKLHRTTCMQLNDAYGLEIPWSGDSDKRITKGMMTCVSIDGGPFMPASGSFIAGLRHDTNWGKK